MTAGDLEFSKFEARVRFTSPAHLPFWSGNALRSGFGARLKGLVCLAGGMGLQKGLQDECPSCPHREMCVYDYFYNARPPSGAKVLRRQSDPPRPFAFEPPQSGRYEPGAEAVFGFTLFGRAIQYLPYFLITLRNLGESGLGSGYREGQGRFILESVDSLGYGARSNIFAGDTVFNRSILLSYQEIINLKRFIVYI